MLWFKSESLEGFLKFNLLVLVILICTLYTLLAWKFQLAWHWIAAGEVLVFLICLWFVTLIRQRVSRTFTRACLYTEAIAKGEYEQFNKAAYTKGKVSELYTHLSLLSQSLQNNVVNHGQEALFTLLEALPAPVLVLNQTSEMSYANQALYDVTQCSRGSQDSDVIKALNLAFVDEHWQLDSSNTDVQLLSSTLVIDTTHQQLLIFVDISSAQSAAKQQAWFQLIERIYALGLNTLTPIASLSEQLKAVNRDNPEITQSCDAISQSCDKFNHGLSRYINFSAEPRLNLQWILLSEFLLPHQQRYPELTLTIEPSLSQIWCDVERLQSVMLDLLQNAYEANTEQVNISFSQHEQYVVMEISDDGEGFSNLEQVAEPFYTRKADAEGLSLYFAKSVIENHSGLFECQNNIEKGASVMIALPLPKSHTS